MYYSKLTTSYPIITNQINTSTLAVVLRELEQVVHNQFGLSIVEFGCYSGTTSLFIRRLLNLIDPDNQYSYHVYDSFQGLPSKSIYDQSRAGDDFQIGKLCATKKQFITNFYKAKLELPYIHKDWFHQLTADNIPPDIAFAFLDGDFYESILKSLELIWPNMIKGGTIIIDDYNREALPGVNKAIDHFFHKRNIKMKQEQNTAIIKI